MINFDLSLRGARLALLLLALLGCGGLASWSLRRFTVAVAADPHAPVNEETLAAAALYFPDSARLQGRLAARLVEAGVSTADNQGESAERLVQQASQAVRLAPHHFEPHLLLAAAQELKGDLAGAEASVRQALTLAPHHANVHWRLANLLIRAGRLEQALPEFRAAAAADPRRLPASLNLVWQASDGALTAVQAVASETPQAQLSLAQFLLAQQQVEAAVQCVATLDRQFRLVSPESGRFLESLIAAGNYEAAAKLWRSLFESDGKADSVLLWNGGFELAIYKGLTQFNWNFTENRYAQIGVTDEAARTGRQSLKLRYLSVHTTHFDQEIRQLVPVRLGAHYRLTGYVRAEALVSPDGPRLALLTPDGKTVIAETAPATAGTHDWQPLMVDFVAPARALLLTIRQTPQFSYTKPTSGDVWFDDFVLQELEGRAARS